MSKPVITGNTTNTHTVGSVARPHVLVGIEGRKQGVLEGRVLGRLLEVAVHLASSREDALDTTRGGGRSQVLLDHLGERWPPALLGPPPLEHV